MNTKLVSRLLLGLAPIVLAIGVAGPAATAVAQQTSSSAPAAATPVEQEITPQSLALARKYVDMTSAGLFTNTLALIASQISSQLTPQHPDQAGKINQTIGQVLTTYKSKDSAILDTFARIYAVTFTEAELQQIVDFYSSPVGLKLTAQRSGLAASQQQALSILQNTLGNEIMSKVKTALLAEGIEP